MNFKELRVNAELRQVDVAKKMHLDQSTVSGWESQGCVPLRKVRKKLARLYGVEVSEIEAACLENETARTAKRRKCNAQTQKDPGTARG